MQETAKTFDFFLPSPELAEAIVQQNQALVYEYAKRTTPEIDIEGETEDRSLLGGLFRGSRPNRIGETRSTQTAQHVIAERLYHYLSSLSETPWALAGGEFPIAEYVTDGMGTMLGLSVYRKEPDSPRGKEGYLADHLCARKGRAQAAVGEFLARQAPVTADTSRV